MNSLGAALLLVLWHGMVTGHKNVNRSTYFLHRVLNSVAILLVIAVLQYFFRTQIIVSGQFSRMIDFGHAVFFSISAARIIGGIGFVFILAYGAQGLGVPIFSMVTGFGISGIAVALAVAIFDSSDTQFGMKFTGINFFDGQGFMVPMKTKITSPSQLSNISVCVKAGTTSKRSILNYLRCNNLNNKIVVYDRGEIITIAYDSGCCDVYTADASVLAAQRLNLHTPEDHLILSEFISQHQLLLFCVQYIFVVVLASGIKFASQYRSSVLSESVISKTRVHRRSTKEFYCFLLYYR